MVTTTMKTYNKDQIATLYDFFEKKSDQENQRKMLDFLGKKDQGTLNICFSGHFSAGKSTFINKLMSKPLLPQSPIPTSANIVEIKRGTEKVIVHFTESKPVQIDSSIPVNDLHALCRDGEKIKKLEIYKDLKALPENVTIMDTPGIDAADDADRLMTESALHTVDVLFYVMDYNHVQSEVNAMFLKHLESKKKPYYVVVNQIDKHDEQEIPFEQFRQSLVSVFEQWDISPNGVYYTSLTEPELSMNQWQQVITELENWMTPGSSAQVDKTIKDGLEEITDQYISNLEKQKNDVINHLEQELYETTPAGSLSYQEALDKKNKLENHKKTVKEKYHKLLDDTIKNAPLMPYELRELATDMLKAFEPNFKTGLFRNKKKIKKERETRLERFYKQLTEQVEVNIEWKLRDKLTEFLKDFVTVSFPDSIFKDDFDKHDCTDFMSEGTKVNGDYVLVYTDKISQHVKKMYRQYYKDQWFQFENQIFQKLDEQIDELSFIINMEKEREIKQKQIQLEQQNVVDEKKHLDIILKEKETVNEETFQYVMNLMKKRSIAKVVDFNQVKRNQKPSTELKPSIEKKSEKNRSRFIFEQTLQDAIDVSDHLESISALESVRKDLISKAERLKNRNFTIALFGAFSAGKSSFANALIGKDVLPVSPNPTTAAINKISPSNSNYRHGDVLVTLKSEQELIADIKTILADKDFSDLLSIYKWLNKMNINKLKIDHQHKSFLSAFVSGFTDMKSRVGTSYLIELQAFHRYVQDETLACFVKEMELFYDCPLTQNNITLVDTPGADSVNARHTDLSFSYIKSADAILFVTYYNHPFAKPDQEFLTRLGRVKDAFQLDKMFFIINAMDLAKDQQEVEMVTQYIKEQLQEFDIYQPRMYPLSSKLALNEKLSNQEGTESGFSILEDDFYLFIKEELTQMSMQAIYTDIVRAHALIEKWLEWGQSDETRKEELLHNNKANKEKMMNLIKGKDSSYHTKAIKQKLNKQCFYVQQRLSIQFTDLFRAEVHPGAIQSSGRRGKEQLKLAIEAFLQGINKRIRHELEAIFVRMETTWNKEMYGMWKEINEDMKKIDASFSLSSFETIAIETPGLELEPIGLQDKEIQSFVANYKDTKGFFALDGRQELEAALKEKVLNLWNNYMTKAEDQLYSFYEDIWKEKEHQIRTDYQDELTSYYEHMNHGLMQTAQDLDQLQKLEPLLKQKLK
ncbi:dynamin family protein [Gracilibacillus sp. YIM 98692]|uniref:dynamin family protein n=1 Tax=Gracilibacillus sp. YIM 98692 TaxID=2663532 RepID=UPI0013D13440|nr:dynamin family protein [Gracilibacillus sp. YIM 98692]